MVINFGKWIAKHKILVIIFAVLLMIPAVIGYIKTRVNYDILSYLPNPWSLSRTWKTKTYRR